MAVNRQQQEKASNARKLMEENLRRLQGNNAPVREAAPAPEPPPVEEAPQQYVEEAVVEEAPPVDLAAEYEQKWRTADGMLKQQGAEFRRIKAEMEAAAKQAREEAAAARAEAERLQAEMERVRPVSGDEVKKYFTTEQIERLGEDECRELLRVHRQMADDASRVTKASVQRELSSVLESVNAEKQSLAALKQEQFFGTVDALMPEWRNIDNDPAFMTWLEEVDPMSGHTRRELGISARDSLNAKRFAAIYTAFKDSQAKSTSVASPKRLLPNGVPSASTPTSQPKQAPVSLSEIKEYQSKQARGYYKMHPKELERDRQRVLSALPQRAR